MHLPKSLVPDGPHKQSVEAVGQIVERAEPPTHVAVFVPKPGDPHPGVPHIVFDELETRPFHMQLLPPSQMAEFINKLKDTVDDHLTTS